MNLFLHERIFDSAIHVALEQNFQIVYIFWNQHVFRVEICKYFENLA